MSRAKKSVSFTGAPVAFDMCPRPLSWSIKVSNLRKAIDLLTTLGGRVLNHEEFDQGGDANSTGPYAGQWSKTMVSFGSDDDTSFGLTLIFNYGVQSYTSGNDLVYICLP